METRPTHAQSTRIEWGTLNCLGDPQLRLYLTSRFQSGFWAAKMPIYDVSNTTIEY